MSILHSLAMLACFCYDAIRLTHATHEAIMVYAGHGDSANMWQQNIVVFLLLLRCCCCLFATMLLLIFAQ